MRIVEHEPEWASADLPVNAAGDTRPGFVCVHELENGNGLCGGNVFRLEDAVGAHRCVVDIGELQTGMATPSFHNRIVVTFVPNIRDPKAPTQEDINKPGSVRISESDFTLSPWLDDEPPDDIGEPPAGWCPKSCRCGEACGEFAGHLTPCACMGNGDH